MPASGVYRFRVVDSRRRKLAFTLFCLGVALAVATVLSPRPLVAEAWMLHLTNNPDHFFLWGTTQDFQHGFNYDPHAADEWRFEIGGPLETIPAMDWPIFLQTNKPTQTRHEE
ncbi:MAG: hypothetical protein ACLQVW_01895 [Limisphaerales bacterium]